MSTFGIMRSAISGMSAQSNRLATVADNIANSATTGYKRASTEFSALLEERSPSAYSARGVMTHVRHAVSMQGNIAGTTSATDLAIDGDGFFVVSDSSGRSLLSRAGSFIPDSQGRLVNAAGFYLRGVDVSKGAGTVPNQTAALDIVTLPQGPQVQATTLAEFSANLPAESATAAPATWPSLNAANAAASASSSLVVYDSLGGAVTLDLHFTRTGPAAWEVAVFNRADAAAGGGFPYASGPLGTAALAFEPSSGRLAPGSASAVSFTVPGGQATTLDLAGTVQLAAPFSVLASGSNGFPPSSPSQVAFDADGTMSAIFADGTRVALWRVPIADVASRDNLTPVAGTAFAVNGTSGDVVLHVAGESGKGRILQGGLEASTVDLASELTIMIESQRAYTANSRVFQTGAEVLDTVVNMK